jgi:hypothetical protein
MELCVEKELDGIMIARGWAGTTEGQVVVLGRMIATVAPHGSASPSGT